MDKYFHTDGSMFESGYGSRVVVVDPEDAEAVGAELERRGFSKAKGDGIAADGVFVGYVYCRFGPGDIVDEFVILSVTPGVRYAPEARKAGTITDPSGHVSYACEVCGKPLLRSEVATTASGWVLCPACYGEEPTANPETGYIMTRAELNEDDAAQFTGDYVVFDPQRGAFSFDRLEEAEAFLHGDDETPAPGCEVCEKPLMQPDVYTARDGEILCRECYIDSPEILEAMGSNDKEAN